MLPLSHLEISTESSVDGTQMVGLRYGDLHLSNSIEYADWHSDPVCPWVCWDCQYAWCAQICLSRVVRTESQLLFMPPYYATALCDPTSDDYTHKLLEDSLLIPFGDWLGIRETVPALPDPLLFPKITNHDLIQLWLQQRPSFAVENRYPTLEQHVRRNCIASHPWSCDQFCDALARQLHELNLPPCELSGEFQQVEAMPNTDEFNTLYFDFENTPEWVTLRVTDQALVIAGQYIFETNR